MPLDAELERKLDMSLAELELSVRATNCLESEGITTVRDLVSRTEDQLLKSATSARPRSRKSAPSSTRSASTWA